MASIVVTRERCDTILRREQWVPAPHAMGGGVGVEVSRQDVVAALRAHGLSGPAAAALWTVGRDLVARTRRHGLEHNAMVDAESGIRTGPLLSGEAHRMTIDRQLAAMRRGREYGHLHTHPANSSFSGDDIRVLLDNAQLRALTVVGVDSRWHIMSRLDDVSHPHGWDAGDAFASEFEALLDDASRPFSEIAHRVWLRSASRLGLRYDRIEEAGK